MLLTTSEHQSRTLKPPFSVTAHACEHYLHMQEGCWWIFQLHEHGGQDSITISTASLQSSHPSVSQPQPEGSAHWCYFTNLTVLG